jgi:hypothetical protein
MHINVQKGAETHYKGCKIWYGMPGILKKGCRWQNVAQRSCSLLQHLQATCSQIVYVMHASCMILTKFHLLNALEGMESTKKRPNGRISISEMSLTKPFKCSSHKESSIASPFLML